MTVEYDVGTGKNFDINMDVKHKIIDNFLDKNNLEELENHVMSTYMPWYFYDYVNIIGDDYFQFVYAFVNPGGEPNCNELMMNLLEPFALKLKIKNFHRVKANLSTKTNKIIEHGMHTDRSNMKGKTGIFYLNTCNGYTKLENGIKIKSKKNRFVEFDCNTRHTGSSCTDQKRRVVINFNY